MTELSWRVFFSRASKNHQTKGSRRRGPPKSRSAWQSFALAGSRPFHGQKFALVCIALTDDRAALLRGGIRRSGRGEALVSRPKRTGRSGVPQRTRSRHRSSRRRPGTLAKVYCWYALLCVPHVSVLIDLLSREPNNSRRRYRPW